MRIERSTSTFDKVKREAYKRAPLEVSVFSLDCPRLVSLLVSLAGKRLRLSVAAYPGMSSKPAGNHRGEDRNGALNAFVS
jgi:hypothetical protein